MGDTNQAPSVAIDAETLRTLVKAALGNAGSAEGIDEGGGGSAADHSDGEHRPIVSQFYDPNNPEGIVIF